MLIESLLDKISESIDELGRLLDQIYKFPIKLREDYVNEIQSMKNKLITLKSAAKDSNLILVQKQYKQLFLGVNKLKNEIYDKLTLLMNKQNKDHNRSCFKDIKKNHDHAMKMIIEKDQEIQKLNQIIYEKQQLIHINFEELRHYKQENQILRETNQIAKYDISRAQIENSTNLSLRNRAEDQALNYRLKDQEREKAFRQAIDELQRLRVQLIKANQKLEYYEQLAEISMNKTRSVEQNIRMVQQQAQYLNDNYRMKQSQTIKQIREIQKMEYELKRKDESISKLQNQNDRLKEDLQVMDHELSSLQNQIYQQKMNAYQEKAQIDKQTSKMKEQNELLKSISQQLTQKLQKCKQTQAEYKSKLYHEESQRMKLQNTLKQLIFDKQNLLLTNLNLQTSNQQYEKQLKYKEKEKQKIMQQLSSITSYYKQLQIDNKSLKQASRSKQQEKNMYANECEKMQLYMKQLQKSMNLNAKSSELLQEESLNLKSQIVRLQQKILQKQGKMQCLEKRLLRAKIQTIHELRQTLL